MVNKFLTVILLSLGLSLFSMQSDKNSEQEKLQSIGELARYHLVLLCLDHTELVLIKDMKSEIINFFIILDCLKALKNKDYENARELFLIARLNPYTMLKTLQCTEGAGETFFNLEVVMLFEKAAELADSLDKGLAESNYGYLCERGFGVEKDSNKAFHWYSLAAKQGNAQAFYKLGIMYSVGLGVEKDIKKALDFCKLAGKCYRAS